jgi:hypothetical protein
VVKTPEVEAEKAFDLVVEELVRIAETGIEIESVRPGFHEFLRLKRLAADMTAVRSRTWRNEVMRHSRNWAVFGVSAKTDGLMTRQCRASASTARRPRYVKSRRKLHALTEASGNQFAAAT